MKRTYLGVILLLLASLTAKAQIPIQVDPETAAQHLLDHPKAIYPPIARAAHVYGVVTLQVLIDPLGHVVYAMALHGPPMLISGALDAVKRYTYTPFQQDGKSIKATTLVAMGFLPNGSSALVKNVFQPSDPKRTLDFLGIYMDCNWQVAENNQVGNQVKDCQEAVRQAETFSRDTHIPERRTAYVEYATALMRDGMGPEAVEMGNKAVAAAMQSPQDSFGAAAAYAVTGEALDVSGNLTEADKELTVAENYERKGLHSLTGRPAKARYLPALEQILQLHARVLTALGNSNAAQMKLKEAASL